jgi:hypothetical protein
MSKIPPAAWQDPEAFEPDEVREAETEPDKGVAAETELDDGSFKEIAEEQDEAVEDPEED